jgi:hypothetical protein
MKLKLSNFYLLCDAVNIMMKTRVAGMAKYVWDLNVAMEQDRMFFASELQNIEKKYGKINPECEEYKQLMEYDTSELPVLPKEKIELLDEYPFLPLHYGLMLELVEKEVEG